MKYVTLEMTVRLLAESLSKDVVRHLVEEACEHPSLFLRREAGGTSKLQHGEILRGDDVERCEALRSILTCDPSLVSWISGGWNPSSHLLFPAKQRQEIRTALLSLHRQMAPVTLAISILEFAFGSDWAVGSCLDALPEGARFLDEKDASVLLNSGVTLDLEAQRRLIQSCEENAERVTIREPRILSALEYCTGRRTLQSGFDFDVTVAPSSENEKCVIVKARNTVRPVERPLLFALLSGHIANLGADHNLQHPGRPATENSSVKTTRNWIPLDALGRFRSFEAKNLRLRRKAAISMSKTLRLRHRNPLQHWDVSMGQVLSFSDSTTRERFVGLLMEEKPSSEESNLEGVFPAEEEERSKYSSVRHGL